MDKKMVVDLLYYRYFRVLYNKNLKRFHGDIVLAFSHAIVESSNAKIKDKHALGIWAKQFSRCRSYSEVNSDAA
jgi:hypothetical protein